MTCTLHPVTLRIMAVIAREVPIARPAEVAKYSAWDAL